jgi:transposase
MNKTEALRLADELEAPVGTQSTYSAMQQAAAELRRLHAQRDALLEALKLLLSYTLACEAMLNARPAGQIDIAPNDPDHD